MRNNFNTIYEVNLHGGTNEKFKGAAQDQNVFDIAQTVAIHCYACSGQARSMTIDYVDFAGNRELKYELLLSSSIESITWGKVKPDVESLSFSLNEGETIDFNLRIDDVFVQYGAGVKTNNDSIVIDYDAESVLRNVAAVYGEFSNLSLTDAPIFDIQYRPLDFRKIFYEKDVVKSRSLPTMRHLLEGENIGLIASSTWTTPERFSVSVSTCMVEMKTGTHDRGTTLFPLYLYHGVMGDQPERRANLSGSFVAK